MSWHVSIRPAAKADLQQARDWYEQRREGLGDEFLIAVAETIIKLEESPQKFSIYYREFRRALVDRFPYKIFFTLEADAVIIFRILHAARNHARQLRGE